MLADLDIHPFLARLGTPLVLAVVVTLANAAKPVVVDDAAYLAFAAHIATRPADPYGFALYWYDDPDPAMDILCPPVLPYWLAAGVRLFGVEPVLLKLWLFPFVWLLAWAANDLLRRLTRGTKSFALPLVMLSPAVLPTVNLMLDIPAVALGLAAVALFARSRGWPGVVLAGALAGLAMQTKYSALVTPAVVGWYGLTHRRVWPAVAAGVAAVAVFAGWEGYVAAVYGESHFLHHLAQQKPSAAGWFADKSVLVAPLAAHLGLLGAGFALVAGRAVGVSSRALAWAAGAFAVGAALVAVLPESRAVLIPGKDHPRLTLPTLVWRTAGTAVLAAAAAAAWVLLTRGRRVRRWRGSWFVVGWVLVELAGYFAMTPFPAARRVIGVSLAVGVLAARAVSRTRRRPPRWAVGFAAALGVLAAALDGYDALPEKVIAERAAAVLPAGTRGWFVGHWGFQFYCERAGLRAAVPGSELAAGDYVLQPIFPDPDGFYRPYPGGKAFAPPADAVEVVAEFVWDDWLAAQTVPNFYGGTLPVTGRDHPRLRVRVLRMAEAWRVPP